MEILKVQQLCKTYGSGEAKVDALKNVSFSLEKGQFAAVVGESGSGKSTLLNCIGALDTPTSGKIQIDGQDLFSMKEEKRTIFRRRNIGFIFQSFQLVPELDVEQNIIFPLLLDYKKPEQAKVEEILEVLGLTERRHHLPSQLSGGQQQRVAIGRALITKPKLILADEPTGNLDSKSGREVMEMLHQLNQQGNTILLITHDNDIAMEAGRRLAIHDGKIFSSEEYLKQANEARATRYRSRSAGIGAAPAGENAGQPAAENPQGEPACQPAAQNAPVGMSGPEPEQAQPRMAAAQADPEYKAAGREARQA